MKTPLLALAGPTGARTRPLAWASLAVLLFVALALPIARSCSGAHAEREALREYQQDQQRIQQSPPPPLDARQQEQLRATPQH